MDVSNTIDDAIHLVRTQAALLSTTATGGPKIDTVESQYETSRAQLRRVLSRLDVADPFPWSTLWEWHGFYSGNFQHWAERRLYISSLVNPVLEQLERLKGQGTVTDWGQPSESWESLDRRLDELKRELTEARTLDGWQDVGRRAREIIIAAVNFVFEDSMVVDGEPAPKGNGAKAKIELYLQAKIGGSAHAELRHLMKSALKLAHGVTHSDSITTIDALAVAQATLLVVRCLQKIEDSGESIG